MITVLHLTMNADSAGSQLLAQNELSRSWILMRGDDKAAIADFFKSLKAGPRNGLTLRPVATLEGDDLSEAFEKTNHIDRPWTQNPPAGLRVMDPRARSTSVGDLMVIGSVAHVVMPIGFQAVEWGDDERQDPHEAEAGEVDAANGAPLARERMTLG